MKMTSITDASTTAVSTTLTLSEIGRLVLVLLCVLVTAKATACPHHQHNKILSTLGTAQCERSELMPKALRLNHYRAPTPDCSPQGRTLNTQDLQALIADQKPLLIDVLSVLRRPAADGFAGEWLPNEERLSLPNAVWLPNVGYGTLNSTMDNWFKQSLHELTQGNLHHPIVLFCIADCWMSWNAIERAHSYGYDNLYWYKNGTDGWQEHALPLTVLTPTPLLDYPLQ